MEAADKYIRPTKQSPIFVVECNWIGFIEESFYKEYAIKTPDNCTHCGSTFALHFTDGITKLHNWIVENPQVLLDYPKCKFTLLIVDGSFDPKYNEIKYRPVYSITARSAKQLLF